MQSSSCNLLRPEFFFSDMFSWLQAFPNYQKCWERGVREGGVAPIRRKLRTELHNNCSHFIHQREEGCAKLLQSCRKFEHQFWAILGKCLYSNAPFLISPHCDPRVPSPHSAERAPSSSHKHVQGNAGCVRRAPVALFFCFRYFLRFQNCLEASSCMLLCCHLLTNHTRSMRLYIYIYMPKTSSGGQILGFKMSKSRGREEKLRQKRAERRRKKKEEERRRKKKKLGNMKTPTFLVGFFWPNLTIELGKIEIFDQKVPTSWGLPQIYENIDIEIYI